MTRKGSRKFKNKKKYSASCTLNISSSGSGSGSGDSLQDIYNSIIKGSIPNLCKEVVVPNIFGDKPVNYFDDWIKMSNKMARNSSYGYIIQHHQCFYEEALAGLASDLSKGEKETIKVKTQLREFDAKINAISRASISIGKEASRNSFRNAKNQVFVSKKAIDREITKSQQRIEGLKDEKEKFFNEKAEYFI